LLPGPVIMLVGKANILSKRISGSTADANFDALAVFDGEAGSFDLDIHAHYQIPIVLEIEADGKLHVQRGKGWYFALGLPPHDQRIKARVFDLFETDTYFVVNDTGLITGAWAGFRKSWDYDVLSLSVNAYIASLLAMQWTPPQIGGGIELHGELHVEV